MTQIKICGISKKDEVDFCKKMGADYLGLLVEIPRTNLSISQKKAKEFVLKNKEVKFIALTIETNLSKLNEMIDFIRPWGVQLLKPSKEIVKELKKRNDVKVIPVVHIVDKSSIIMAKKYYEADYLLLDSKHGRNLGGTGKTHNWEYSKKIVNESPIPVFLAGGLNVDNIPLAINLVKPYAVDAESSLRNREGHRDLKKVKKIILQVHKKSSLNGP